jgi:hypothetical protein
MSVTVPALRPRHMKAKVKITITNPDGSVARVVEGEYDDPFTTDFDFLFSGMFMFPYVSPSSGVAVHDVAGNLVYLFSPASLYYTPIASLCVANCPYASNVGYTLKMPGIWLYKSPFSPYNYVWANYSNLISNITYYSPSVSPNNPNSVAALYGGTATFTVTQQMTNTSGSTITVASFAVVAVLYGVVGGAWYTTPVYIGINYFDISPAITWSPSAGMTVTVTYQIPN